ncbi:MAG: hypothetical protein CL600_01290 [Alteromonas sp.]|nr:hypothetical protein [Alteromonas sp.]
MSLNKAIMRTFSSSKFPQDICTVLVMEGNRGCTLSLGAIVNHLQHIDEQVSLICTKSLLEAKKAISAFDNIGVALINGDSFEQESLLTLINGIKGKKVEADIRCVVLTDESESNSESIAIQQGDIIDELWVSQSFNNSSLDEFITTIILGNINKWRRTYKENSGKVKNKEDKIAALERRITREKQARLIAEQQLVDYAKKSYIASSDLRDTVKKLQDKQQEIEFFIQSAKELKSGKSGLDMINSFLSICVDFISAEGGACYLTNSGTLGEHGLVYKRNTSFNFKDVVEEYLPSHTLDILDSWSVQEVSTGINAPTTWFIATNFRYIDNSIGWLCFVVVSPQISEQKLYILDTYLEQLRMGIAQQKELNAKAQKLHSDSLKQELADTKRQLVVADRMSSIGFLSSGVAHEINNPLAFLVSNNRYLQKSVMAGIKKFREIQGSDTLEEVSQKLNDLRLSDLEQDFIEIFEDNTHGLERLSSISDNLRQFTRINDNGFIQVDLNQCIKRTVKMASMSKKAVIPITVEACSDNALVLGNEGEIEQVLLNIMINALQAVNEDGQVAVSLTKEDSRYHVAIKDDGVGIAPGDIDKIFSPFFTSKSASEGTGLGLAISKTIIEAHNGDINVESTIGVGTTFTVSIPLLDTAHSEQGAS